MQYNSADNKNGLVQDVCFLCHTTTAAYALADITRNINQAYYDVNRLIWECSDEWHYDDLNNSDYPTAYVTLVDGQQRYSIPSTAQRIRRIEIKNNVGDWVKLEPLPEGEIDVSLREYLDTAGLPTYYNLVGNLIEFYPPVSNTYCTLASGGAVFLDRYITEFTTASTTASPGFATPFHRILSLQAALDFEPDQNSRQLFLTEKVNLIEGLKRFYSNRELETSAQIKPRSRRMRHQYE